MKAERNNEPFTFRMTSGEAAAAVLYLPVHIWLLPRLLLALPETRELSELSLNLLVYGIGAVTMLLLLGRYLRREFDPLADHPLNILFQVLVCYGMMLAFNMMMNAVLTLLLPDNLANPNNSAVLELADREFGKTTAMAVFLAPLVEEPIFAAGSSAPSAPAAVRPLTWRACCSFPCTMYGAMLSRIRPTGFTCWSTCRPPGCCAVVTSAVTVFGAAFFFTC